LLVSFQWGGIFAIHSGFAGSDRGYRRGGYRVVERGGELIPFQLRVEFCLPYDDYKIYRRWPHFPRCVDHLGVVG
jgi:hypothetical protein